MSQIMFKHKEIGTTFTKEQLNEFLDSGMNVITLTKKMPVEAFDPSAVFEVPTKSYLINSIPLHDDFKMISGVELSLWETDCVLNYLEGNPPPHVTPYIIREFKEKLAEYKKTLLLKEETERQMK